MLTALSLVWFWSIYQGLAFFGNSQNLQTAGGCRFLILLDELFGQHVGFEFLAVTDGDAQTLVAPGDAAVGILSDILKQG